MPKIIRTGPQAAHPAAAKSATVASSSQVRATVPPKSAGRVIQAEVVGATKEAARIVAEAEREAQRILDEARASAAETHEQGYNDGYQEGLGQYTEETATALLALEKKEQEMEGEFIRLVRACVEKILGQEITTNPDAVVGLVRSALQDARQQREIIVRVNPEDAEALRKNQRRLLETLARASAIEVREDPSVERGGCVIMTELGTIDASLDRQLRALETVLEAEFRSGADPSANSTAKEAASAGEVDGADEQDEYEEEPDEEDA